MVLKEDKDNAINGKQKDCVREEIVAVSGTTLTSVQNRRTGKPVAFWIIVRQLTHASLKPTNLRENVRKEPYTKRIKNVPAWHLTKSGTKKKG